MFVGCPHVHNYSVITQNWHIFSLPLSYMVQRSQNKLLYSDYHQFFGCTVTFCLLILDLNLLNYICNLIKESLG